MRHKGLDRQTAKLSGFLALNHLTAKDVAKLPLTQLKKLKGASNLTNKDIGLLDDYRVKK